MRWPFEMDVDYDLSYISYFFVTYPISINLVLLLGFFFRFLFPISDERMGIKDYGCMYIDSAIRMEGSGRRYRAVGICEVNLFNVSA